MGSSETRRTRGSDLSRRLLLGAGGLAALLGATGCSALPDLPFGGPDSGLETLLRRIGDPALAEPSELTTFVAWTRPAEAAEALGLDASATLSGRAPGTWLEALTVTDPVWFRDAAFRLSGADDLEFLGSAQRLITPTGAVRVWRREVDVALWTGAAGLLDDLEEAFGGVAERSGDELRVTDSTRNPDDPATRLIAAVGDDLVLTTAETADGLDSEDSVVDLFTDLGELFSTMDLEEPHLVTGALLGTAATGSGAPFATTHLVATRFDSPEHFTSRGAARVQGDAEVVAQRMLEAGKADQELTGAIRVIGAEADGDLVALEFASSAPQDDLYSQSVEQFHRNPPRGLEKPLE